MKDVLFLVCNREKVEYMRKTLPDIKRGEILVKLSMEVAPKAFGSPTIEKQIYVEDWKEGIDIEDVEFRKNTITKEEAELIKTKRIEKMKQILENQGYVVEKPEKKEKKSTA